jgi:hypothetical protein
MTSSMPWRQINNHSLSHCDCTSAIQFTPSACLYASVREQSSAFFSDAPVAGFVIPVRTPSTLLKNAVHTAIPSASQQLTDFITKACCHSFVVPAHTTSPRHKFTTTQCRPSHPQLGATVACCCTAQNQRETCPPQVEAAHTSAH